MKALFGSSKPKEEPKPPQLTNEQMKEMQREFKKKLNKEIREIEKQIYSKSVLLKQLTIFYYTLFIFHFYLKF